MRFNHTEHWHRHDSLVSISLELRVCIYMYECVSLTVLGLIATLGDCAQFLLERGITDAEGTERTKPGSSWLSHQAITNQTYQFNLFALSLSPTTPLVLDSSVCNIIIIIIICKSFKAITKLGADKTEEEDANLARRKRMIDRTRLKIIDKWWKYKLTDNQADRL